MSVELSGAALYQQYLQNRRNFTPNQRARLNEYIAGITRRGGPNQRQGNILFTGRNPSFNQWPTQRSFTPQTQSSWVTLPQQSRMPLRGPANIFGFPNITRTTRFPNRFPPNNWTNNSLGQRRVNNFNSNVLNNDVSLAALNRSRDPQPYLVTNQEWFMTVYANNDGKDSKKDIYKPIHPANIRSTKYLCAAFSQWRIRRFSLTFHSYLPMTEVATVFAGLSYDYHSSRPKGRDIASLKPSVNFTTSDRSFLVLDSDSNLPQELFSTDQMPDLHETVRNLYPGGILTDGVYLVSGTNPPNHEIGYWDIDYEIEFLHPRSDSTPQSDSVKDVYYEKDDDDQTLKPNKFFCISRKTDKTG